MKCNQYTLMFVLSSLIMPELMFSVKVTAQLDICGAIGMATDEQQPSRSHGLFLDTLHPAACNGTADQFHYCYYNNNNLPLTVGLYRSNFAIYRETSSGMYSRSSKVYTVERNILNRGLRSFNCVTVDTDSELEIFVGDVIGVCIFDPPNSDGRETVQLDIVGMSNNESQFLLSTGNSDCGESTLPQSLNSQSLNVMPSLELHFTASIVRSMDTGLMSPTDSEPDDDDGPIAQTTDFVATDDDLIAQTTDFVTTDDMYSNGAENSSDAGVIAAILVSVVIMLVLTVAIITSTVLLLLKRANSPDHRKAPFSSGIDNAVYSTSSYSLQDNTLSSDYEDAISIIPSSRAAVSGSQSLGHTYERPDRLVEELDLSMYEVVCPNIRTENSERRLSVTLSYRDLLERNRDEDIYGNINPYETPASKEDDIYSQLKSWELRNIKRADIKVTGHLGSGQYGSVEQGVWRREGDKSLVVALKSLSSSADQGSKVKFLQEAAIMAQFKHPNVIMLHGMVIRSQPMMLVVELASNKDLKRYLMSLRPSSESGELVHSSTPPLLLRFSQQVALGMQYLSAKGFVHRDLAARNILLTETLVCKVADFGMSRDLADETYYVSNSRDKIPVKWTAPEALHYKKYSTASDVWSYGCLLFEIWSIGQKPFKGISSLETIRRLESGKRLPPPPGCPKAVYQLMINCWNPSSSQRPGFREVLLSLVEDEREVLNIPLEESPSTLASQLGAPLQAGEGLYTQLQHSYIRD